MVCRKTGILLILGVHVCSVSQLCPILWVPMDYDPPGSSAHGILHARILYWIAISSSTWSSQPRKWTPCLLHVLHWQVYPLPLTHLETARKIVYIKWIDLMAPMATQLWGYSNKSSILIYISPSKLACRS